MSVFERVKVGLEECIAHAKGELTLVTTVLPSPPPAVNAAGVTRIRKRLRMSQGVFAAALNVSPKTVQSWEQGIRQPSQGALRLLEIFDRQPKTVQALFGETTDLRNSDGHPAHKSGSSGRR